MAPTYWDAKRDLKKIYGLGLTAIKRKDLPTINSLLLGLDRLEEALNSVFDVNTFGKYTLNRDIKHMRGWLLQAISKKRTKHEQASRRDTKRRD